MVKVQIEKGYMILKKNGETKKLDITTGVL